MALSKCSVNVGRIIEFYMSAKNCENQFQLATGKFRMYRVREQGKRGPCTYLCGDPVVGMGSPFSGLLLGVGD